jgi:hypothetical protein
MSQLKLNWKKVIGTLFIVVLGASYLYQQGVERHELELKLEKLEVKAQEYNRKLEKCLSSSLIYENAYSSDPRSSKRLEEVALLFNKIVQAPCFKSVRGEMLSNPYKNIKVGELGNREHSPIEEEVFDGFLYEFDKGVPFLRSGWTLCEDGSLSGSVGRGSCSWHGGFAKQRGSSFNFVYAQTITDPKEEINQLLNR